MSNPFMKVYSKEEAKELKKALKNALGKLAKAEVETKPRDEWGREPGDPQYGMPPGEDMPMEMPMDEEEEEKGEEYDFEVIATTEGIDRDGEMIKGDGWDFTNFMKNPVLLWAHDYTSLPIGKVTEVFIEEGAVKVRGIFAKTAFAEEVKSLYDQGILRAVSVGFIPREREGNIITKQELLELSFVAVPSNPDAVTTGKELDTFMRKWFSKEEVKIPEEEQTEETVKENVLTKEVIKTLEPVPNLLAEYPRAKKEENAMVLEKEGRVLSSKNRSLVQNAIDALQALLEASESPKDIQEDLLEIKQKAQAVDKTNEELIRLIKSGLEKVK